MMYARDVLPQARPQDVLRFIHVFDLGAFCVFYTELTKLGCGSVKQ